MQIASNWEQKLCRLRPPLYPIYTEQNFLDRALDSDPDHHLDRYLEDAIVYTGHSFFNITKSATIVFIVEKLFDDP